MLRTHDLLNAWVSAHAGLLIEGQSRLSEIIGTDSPDWELNLSAGLITLNGHRLQFALLGSVTEDDNSWLWSWADPGLDPKALAVARARPLYTFGQESDLWEFQEPTFEVRGIIDLGLTPGASIALVASPQIMGGAIFSGPYPGGRLYVAITDPQLTNEQPSAVTASRHLTAARGYAPSAHRNIVSVYAAAHDLDIVEELDLVSLSFEDGSALEIVFDEDSCIARMRGILPKTITIPTQDEAESDEVDPTQDSEESAENEFDESTHSESDSNAELAESEGGQVGEQVESEQDQSSVAESTQDESGEEVESEEADTPTHIPGVDELKD